MERPVAERPEPSHIHIPRPSRIAAASREVPSCWPASRVAQPGGWPEADAGVDAD